jgi:hypothetical protein
MSMQTALGWFGLYPFRAKRAGKGFPMSMQTALGWFGLYPFRAKRAGKGFPMSMQTALGWFGLYLFARGARFAPPTTARLPPPWGCHVPWS